MNDDPSDGALTAPMPESFKTDPAAVDEAARKDVIRLLRGPVAQTFKRLLPELATAEDPYKAILANAQLLGRALKVFESRRDAFGAFLVDSNGAAVTDDAARLVCGRSVNEVSAMAIRSGMRAYAEQHFAAKAKQAASAGAPRTETDAQRAGWIASVATMFRQQQSKTVKPAASDVERFYAAIRGALDFGWQIPFFPIYVEIPVELFEKLGVGITRLNSLEKLQQMARLSRDDIAKAEALINDAAMTQEMLENNALAATAIGQMTREEFKTVAAGLAHLDVRKKWDIFANTLTALRLGKDKRISVLDITALAEHLDILNDYAVKVIFDLKLSREQFGTFIKTAAEALGRALFLALFGPIPFFGADEIAAAMRRSYVGFVETTLKGLVIAIQQLAAKFRHDAPEVLSECLALVCESRRKTIAAEIIKLLPGGATA